MVVSGGKKKKKKGKEEEGVRVCVARVGENVYTGGRKTRVDRGKLQQRQEEKVCV